MCNGSSFREVDAAFVVDCLIKHPTSIGPGPWVTVWSR
jgi:hypothetical protein